MIPHPENDLNIHEVIGLIDDDHSYIFNVIIRQTIFHSSKLENLLDSKEGISIFFSCVPTTE